MKLLDRERPLDPQAERELDAVDRALAGERVDADLADWGELAALLSDERPEPEARWTEEIDARAARCFRRDDGGGASQRDFAERLRDLLPHRIAAPAGALATLAIVAVVAVSTLGPDSSDSTLLSPGDSGTPATGPAPGQDLQPIPGSGGRLEEIAPSVNGAANGAATADSSSQSLTVPPDEGKIAPGAEKRQVERDVTLALSPRPEDVREVSDEAIAITRSLDGIVASSQITEAGKQARATLQLTIPTRNLDTALDRLTGLANVTSMNESALDVTRPYVSAQDRLEDAEAERRRLLQALGTASTDAEAQALRLQIGDARREISRAESAFGNIARRARLSDVSLTIVGDPSANANDDGRTIGDWLDDAVSVLRDVAGILLISGAILIPLGILIAIAWWLGSRMRRSRRERALEA